MMASKTDGRLRLWAGLCLVIGGLLDASLAAAQSAPRSLPALPGSDSPVSPLEDAAARVRRGVVTIEAGGVPRALGTVLRNDGRILTALSGLAGSDTVGVRYADGSLKRAAVTARDKILDLALLAPQPAVGWTDGLGASAIDPLVSSDELRAVAPTAPANLGPTLATVKGQVDACGLAAGLPMLLDVSVKGPAVVGAPVVDAVGDVVAILAKASRETGENPAPALSTGATSATPATRPLRGACAPALLGVPVAAVKSFLAHAPPATTPQTHPAPWLGIRGEVAANGPFRGVRVLAVAPSSPAETAGLTASDVVFAVDGTPTATADALATAINSHAPGETVKLLVYRNASVTQIAVELRPAP